MNKEILLTQLELALDGKIPLSEFANWYEDWFTSEVEQNDFSNEEFTLLENLFSDIGYFEPDPEIQKEHRSYFGKEAFINKIRTVQGRLKKNR